MHMLIEMMKEKWMTICEINIFALAVIDPTASEEVYSVQETKLWCA
jgi:hypothetical protein